MNKSDRLKKATEKTKSSEVIEDLTYEEKEVKVVDKQKRTNELTFKKLQLKNQILLRPDTYIGSTKKVKSFDPIWVLDKDKFVQKQVAFTEGFVRLFIECISNAIDNVWRSDEFKIPCKFIKVTIDPKENSFSIWNDGKTIPIEKHKEENIHIPELIFGNLLTSSNYNDSEERKTSGKNGLGIKCSNIFSTEFSVECFNPDKGIYKQTWENNMDKVSEPVIDTVKAHYPKKIEDGKNGYTKVSWKPELSRFDMKEVDKETMSVIEKYIVDCAMTVYKYGVKIIYNDKEILMKDYKDYIKYYFKELPDEFLMLNQPENTCILCPSSEFTQVSFVNGIHTKDGGVHVDAWCEQLFRPLLNKLNEKTKKFDMRDIKKHFFIFVNCSLDKPRFDNQSKTRLNSPQPTVEVKPAAITKLSKWKFLTVMKESLKLKDMLSLKNETERKRGTSRIEGLDDANYAGKSGKSQDCILCSTEGLSAKTYVVKGMKYGLFGKKGHDYIGVLPIRGKFINVRNASINSIIKNKEVKSLIQALGLQHGLDYSLEENRKKLRYGKFVCISDADVDGFHITSLLYNFFDVLFPSLVRNNDFFYFMRIPILKITDKKTPKDFYFLNEAQKYLTDNKVKKDNVRYFKGLGTSNDQDIKNDFGKKVVQIECKTKESEELINNIFSKDTADFRKDWLAKFLPEKNKPNVSDKIDIAEFINEELIHFSIDDCKRSIPSLLDGLKESQRKVLYSAIKRNLSFKSKSLKVAQFAGYIAENTNYHHGEQNLYDTITKLAQRFVGSNNIPLLFNDGQFGERIENGKDAANGRYIFTKLDCLTRYIFREEDDEFLEHKNDDGDIIEKKYYIPIVPNILINGNTGIGTGWSCNIPSYNLVDIINWINLWIKEKEAEQNDELVLVDKPELVPYFRNFKGTVKVSGHKVITTGVIKKVGNTYVITEIPIGRKNMSISKYKEKLEELKEKGVVKTIRDNSTENDVNFTITISEDDIEMDNLIELLSLNDTIYTNNMVLFDKNETLQKYSSVQSILKSFCSERYQLYVVRKEGILKGMEFDLKIMKNKKRFITEITEGTMSIKDKEDDELEVELKKKKYDTKEDKYDYLTSIQMKQITKTKINELSNQIEKLTKEIEQYKKLTPLTIWKNELKELSEKYSEYIK